MYFANYSRRCSIEYTILRNPCPLPDHTHPLHQPRIILPGNRYRRAEHFYMVFVDTVDVQDRHHEGAVDFYKHVLRQGFRGVSQGGADHKEGFIDHEYARIILFRGKKSYLLRQEPLQSPVLPHKNGLGHSGSADLIMVLQFKNSSRPGQGVREGLAAQIYLPSPNLQPQFNLGPRGGSEDIPRRARGGSEVHVWTRSG